MGFNYGYEKKKFDSRWKRLEVEYCDAGMSEEQIAAMKEYAESLMGAIPWGFSHARMEVNRCQEDQSAPAPIPAAPS